MAAARWPAKLYLAPDGTAWCDQSLPIRPTSDAAISVDRRNRRKPFPDVLGRRPGCLEEDLWQLIRAIVHEVIKDDCVDLAAQMSFYFSLSLFPFLMVIAGVCGHGCRRRRCGTTWRNGSRIICRGVREGMVFMAILGLTQGLDGLSLLWSGGAAVDGVVGIRELDGVADGGLWGQGDAVLLAQAGDRGCLQPSWGAFSCQEASG